MNSWYLDFLNAVALPLVIALLVVEISRILLLMSSTNKKIKFDDILEAKYLFIYLFIIIIVIIVVVIFIIVVF